MVKFIKELIYETKKDGLLSLSHELTYKILLSIFPFIIFSMTLFGFINIDTTHIIEQVYLAVPDMARHILSDFVEEVVKKSNFPLFSTSLFFSIYNAASGFKAVIRGINKTYGKVVTWGFVKRNLTSISLVFIFVFSVALMMLLIVFGDRILSFLLITKQDQIIYFVLHKSIRFFMAIIGLFFAVSFTYYLSNCQRVKLFALFPGSVFTVVSWMLTSYIYNICINNFFNYSKVYGSIGSIFVLLLWLNIICICLLVGSEINSMIQTKKQ